MLLAQHSVFPSPSVKLVYPVGHIPAGSNLDTIQEEDEELEDNKSRIVGIRLGLQSCLITIGGSERPTPVAKENSNTTIIPIRPMVRRVGLLNEVLYMMMPAPTSANRTTILSMDRLVKNIIHKQKTIKNVVETKFV